MSEPHRPWLREPLVHFVVLGAALAGVRSLADAPPERAPIELGPELDEALGARFAARHGEPPTEDELAGERASWVREEALYREARRLGLDEDDAIVRRRLVQKMELVLGAGLALPAIDAAARRAYLESHAEELRSPERRALELVYFRPERADALGDALVARGALAAGGAASGDPLLAAEGLGRPSEAELSRALGAPLARAAFALPEGVWSEPIATERGTYLVRVAAIEPAALPPIDRVAARIDAALEEEARSAALEQAIEALVARYRGESR